MTFKKILVTGGAGFIGSELVRTLLKNKQDVVAIDNFSGGYLGNLTNVLTYPNFLLIQDDLLNLSSHTIQIIRDCDEVYHLAANPDVRIGSRNSQVDFNNNILSTYNLLEIMRNSDVCKKLIFTSTSTVYGDADIVPTSEDYGPLIPISLYGSSKLAAESLISGYSHMFGIKCGVLRLANIIGATSNHGVIFDFIKKLNNNNTFLEILGNGKQNKSYLYIDDCIDAMLLVSEYLDHNYDGSSFNLFNVGSEDKLEVFSIAKIILRELDLENVPLIFSSVNSDGRGWKGDVKNMLLDISKIKRLGWSIRYQSEEAVRLTVRNILKSQSRKEILV